MVFDVAGGKLRTRSPRRGANCQALSGAAQVLEARRLLSGDGGAPSPSGLPLLHSFAGAPVAIFLDFDGDGASYSPYDTDGDPNTFGPAEQDDVRAMWRQVSVDFSMFDLDVTTEPPGNVAYSYSIISNSVRGGSYNQGGFPSSGAPSNIHGSLEARNRPTVLSHELGHSFGLQHQSVYDQRGHKLAEYHPGHDALHGAIMGVDTAQGVTKWFVGQPSSSASRLRRPARSRTTWPPSRRRSHNTPAATGCARTTTRTISPTPNR